MRSPFRKYRFNWGPSRWDGEIVGLLAGLWHIAGTIFFVLCVAHRHEDTNGFGSPWWVCVIVGFVGFPIVWIGALWMLQALIIWIKDNPPLVAND